MGRASLAPLMVSLMNASNFSLHSFLIVASTNRIQIVPHVSAPIQYKIDNTVSSVVILTDSFFINRFFFIHYTIFLFSVNFQIGNPSLPLKYPVLSRYFIGIYTPLKNQDILWLQGGTVYGSEGLLRLSVWAGMKKGRPKSPYY